MSAREVQAKRYIPAGTKGEINKAGMRRRSGGGRVLFRMGLAMAWWMKRKYNGIMSKAAMIAARKTRPMWARSIW